MARSTAAPLGDLPASPLGDLPASPLGAPPAPPLVGKRQPLRFPAGGRGGGGRSTRAPLPNLDVLNQRRRAVQQAKKQQKAQTPAPAGRTASPVARTAPIVIQPRPAAPAPAQRPALAPRRRTPQDVRETLLGHIEAVHGPQVARHPALQRADIRDNLIRAHTARWRGDLAHVHAAGLAESERIKQEAQRGNPGYSPPQARQPQPQGPGIPPELRAKRAAQYRAMRRTLNGEPPEED